MLLFGNRYAPVVCACVSLEYKLSDYKIAEVSLDCRTEMLGFISVI